MEFAARDPQGPVSVAMFMAHAAPSISADEARCPAVRGILSFCAGRPIALAVTGQAVAFRVALGLEFRSACRTYFEDLMKEMNPGACILATAIHLSLRQLDETIKSRERDFRYTFSDIYESLCILKNQEFAPVSVLACMWMLDIASVFLTG